ncbi:glycoside hydrolase family 3 protein [Gramella sp. BOM4]|nr:glycoside hydrolase family 3 protein [Christiangramia bathymodioli]
MCPKIFVLLAFLLMAINVFAQQMPYQNSSLSFEERAKDLVSRLTLEEKTSLMFDVSQPVPRLGIREFNWWSEALHGYANNDSVTVFPEPIGMAASFNDELVHEVFSAVSDEARAKYHHALRQGLGNKRFLSLSVWTPNVNIFRDPRWGRGQETYGEDPYLMSRMGTAVVKGLQGPEDAKYKKLLACAKHYAVHSGPEWSRHELNVTNVDQRDLWETYLPAFKSLVQDANVRQVMCAYQRFEDEPCCGSTQLLKRILRDDWGFDGVVVSDCGAITDFFTTHNVSSDEKHAAAKAVLAGTDVECQWANNVFAKLPEAVEQGLITEAEIDEHVQRVLSERFSLGEMDDPSQVKWAQIPLSVITSEKHKNLALESARQSMTLLQNKNNILPLQKNIGKIGVIGPNAKDEEMLWGNYNGTPIETVSIYEGISSIISEENIVYDKGCDLVEDKVTLSYFDKLSAEGKKGMKATYWANPNYEGEPVISKQITAPIKLTTAGNHEFASGVPLTDFSAKYETVYKADKTEELVFKFGATGHFELLVNGEKIAEYDNWRTLPTREVIQVEKGKTYTIEIKYAQLNDWQANIEFNFGEEVPVDYTALLEKLADVETVIFVGGLSTKLEGEEMPVNYPGFKGGDRTNIELPAVQRNCLKALKDAGKKVIFVNCSGSAIALTPETESSDAILQAWYGGELGGQAVAETLFGDANPSGKLPVTFYKNSDQLPDFEDYSMDNRTYRFMDDALFPFGFGLSYTSFEIGKGNLDRSTMETDANVTLNIPVTNTGDREGTEIVQVYVHKKDDLEGPIKTLKGFKRVSLQPGETKEVSVILPADAFEFYNRDARTMQVTPGMYEIFYGNSSATSSLQKTELNIQ